jgi:cytochrome c5
MKQIIVTLLLLQGSLFAANEEMHKGIKMPFIEFPMKPGKGMYSTKGKCNMCHSWGYTINQGPQSKAFWRKKVVKMITIFHAPIKNEDVEEVVEYLYANYGNGKEE